jgi:hypothetical protein
MCVETADQHHILLRYSQETWIGYEHKLVSEQVDSKEIILLLFGIEDQS